MGNGGINLVSYVRNYWLISLYWVLLILFILWLHSYIKPSNEKIEKGQIWVSCDSLNPFKAKRYDTIEVLQVKGDFSKIVWNHDTTSVKNIIISYESKLIKNNEK